MTPHQMKLIRGVFEIVSKDPERIGKLFYQHLFEAAPEVRDLFPTEMSGHYVKVMQVLGELVKNIKLLSLPVTASLNAESFLPQVKDLGRRHAGYGVQKEHLAALGQVLIKTLSDAVGEKDFNDEVREAWEDLYELLLRGMLRGVNEPDNDDMTEREQFLERFNFVA